MTTIVGMEPHFGVDSRQLRKILSFIRTATDSMTFSSYQNFSSVMALDVDFNGYKLERNDPTHRIWIGSAYNAFARFLFRVNIRDTDCDFRLIRRTALDDIQLISTSGMTA